MRLSQGIETEGAGSLLILNVENNAASIVLFNGLNILCCFDALALRITAHRVGLYEKQKEPSPKRGRLFPTKNQPY